MSCKRLNLIGLFLFIMQFVYPLYFRQLGVENGLPHFSVLSIYQDILGRMWIGTQEGLGIYDGKEIKTFKRKAEFAQNAAIGHIEGNRITLITGDAKGNVFFLADDALMMYDIRKDYFQTIRSQKGLAITSFQGEIWCAVNDSIFKYDNQSKELSFQLKTNIHNINRLFITNEGELWIGTQQGLFLSKGKAPAVCMIPDISVYSFLFTSKKELWVSSLRDGLYRIADTGKMLKMPYSEGSLMGVASNQVRELIEDDKGCIWFGTFKGLQKYDPSTNEFMLYESSQSPGSLSHSSIFALYKDNQETIWLGTYFGGLNYFNQERDKFSFYPYESGQQNSLSFPLIGNMVEDKYGDLWICTEGGGLNRLDRKRKKIQFYTIPANSASISYDNLKSICYDSTRHCLYIGSHNGGLIRFDIEKVSFTCYLDMSKGDNLHYPGDIIHEIKLYENQLIISARNGTFVMDTATEVFRRLGDGDTCLTFEVDADGYIWLLYYGSISCYKLKDGSDQKKFLLPEKVFITRLFSGKNRVIYAGSLGSGLFCLDRKSDSISNYTVEKDFLLSDFCYNIAETGKGKLLITTDKGVMLCTPSDKMMKITRLEKGVPLTLLAKNCGVYVCKNGEIFIGGINGLVSFQEEELNEYVSDYNIYFSHMQVNNRYVFPGDKTGILTNSLPFTKELKLASEQNNLVFTFAASNYMNTLKDTRYEYKLEGFDKEWIPITTTTLSYTNLNPGRYLLKVRKPAVFSAEEEKEITLGIHIRAPWYNTVWAWITYLLLLSLLMYISWQIKKSRLELALSLREEQSKLRFFTNISHEFKTPLTLIISHLDALLQTGSFPSIVNNRLKKIEKHAYRMRNLITELLDFRKFELEKVTMYVQEQNIVSFVKEIYLSFSDYAKQHRIAYSFQAENDSILLYFDSNQMQKVFFNLLSNAFKFTPDGQYIHVVICEEEDSLLVKVIDGGIGIPSADKKKVFEHFYQASNAGLTIGNPGTGIGLALSKNIVELHQGCISVESSLEYGSIFVVRLKKGVEHLLTTQHVMLEDRPQAYAFTTDLLSELIVEDSLSDAIVQPVVEEGLFTRRTVLLVEDNEELMQILITLFSPFYVVLSAFNGKEGLEKAEEEQPDLIVSDVMMPVMDGIKMCSRIKNDIRLCHIPVILLSALNSDEQSAEGLQCGADDYIGKPFHAKNLLLRCNNQIRNRMKWQDKLVKQEKPDIHLLATNSLDKSFLEQIVCLIEGHLDDVDFDVNYVAKELGLSRSSFFTKFKSLTGMTPSSFILDYKLKKAADYLLENPHWQITEVSDKLGFNTPQYFAKCFKAKFESAPAEYRKKRFSGG